MIDNINIEGYRAIKKIEIHPKRINIFVGANNSGKSSILEFLSLLCMAHIGMKDVIGTNIWQYISKSKQYDPQTLIHSGCSSATISITKDNDLFSLTLNYEETGYSDQKIGGIISKKIYSDADNYLITTDFLKTIRNNVTYSGRVASNDSRGNQFPTYLSQSDEETETDLPVIEPELLSLIKQKIVQEAYQSPKIVISLKLNEKLTHVYADIFIEQYLKDQISIPDVAGLSKIITGLKLYEKPPKDSFQLPTAIRMLISPNFKYVNVLFEKMMNGWEIQSFEEIMKRKIPYLADIKKSTDKGILVYIKGEDSPRPLSTMGDGFIALTEIMALNTLVKNGIVIMEEPENNLHPGFIDIFSEQLLNDTTKNQYFISTHSADLIETTLQRAKFQGKLNEIRLIILHKHLHLSYPVAEEMSGEEAFEEIETIHSDLRGI